MQLPETLRVLRNGTNYGIPEEEYDKLNGTAKMRLKVAYELKVKHYAMEKLAKAAGIEVPNGNFKSTMQYRKNHLD